jgi:hypothetical protein
VESYATGTTRVIQEPVYAYFRVGLLEPQERELALSRWTFNGTFQELDEATTVQPDYRIGVFDSRMAQQEYGWSDEVREHVEQVLTEHAARWTDIIVVPRTMVPPPWPLYDDYRGGTSALVRKLVDEGHDLTQVLAYERAMQHRDTVIAALEAALNETPVEEEVLG